MENQSRKKRNAPDKEKLLDLASRLESFEFPIMKTEVGQKIKDKIVGNISKLVLYIETEVELL